MKPSDELKRRDFTALIGIGGTLLGGGGLGVIINQLLQRDKTRAEARLLDAQADEAVARTSRAVSRINAPPQDSEHADSPIKGWFKAGSAPGDFEIGTDRTELFHGLPTAYIKSRNAPRGFGTVMQMFLADAYLDKRVKLTGYAKSEGVDSWAGFWLRIDGSDKTLGFDNMQDRPIKGATGWTKYQIVLDVPADSVHIALGLLLDGPGRVWLADTSFDIIPATEPITSAVIRHPPKPTNLSFTE